MKTIEISTSQNVSIEYELAPWRERFIASFLDAIVNLCLMGLLIFIWEELDPPNGIENIGYYLFIYPLALMFTFWSEVIFKGQTIGKRAMSLQVVKDNGSKPTTGDYAMRWVMRLVDIWFTAGAVGTLLITSSAKGQRLGDLFSGTVIIKLNPSRVFHLSDILNINTISNYEPQFRDVVRFTEKDMLFIKNVIERFKAYPNDAHREAVDELARHMAKQLELARVPSDSETFLRTLLNDYIVLTR